MNYNDDEHEIYDGGGMIMVMEADDNGEIMMWWWKWNDNGDKGEIMMIMEVVAW